MKQTGFLASRSWLSMEETLNMAPGYSKGRRRVNTSVWGTHTTVPYKAPPCTFPQQMSYKLAVQTRFTDDKLRPKQSQCHIQGHRGGRGQIWDPNEALQPSLCYVQHGTRILKGVAKNKGVQPTSRAQSQILWRVSFTCPEVNSWAKCLLTTRPLFEKNVLE